MARYWVGGTGTWQSGDTSHWSASSGGASGASVPTASDDVYFNGSSGAGTITIGDVGSGVTCLALNFTGFTGTLSALQGFIKIRGNITFGSGMSFSGTRYAFLESDASLTITSNGKSIPFGIYVATGTTTLADDFVTTSSILVGSSTFNAANFNVTVNNVDVPYPYAGTLTMGSGTWTITGSVKAQNGASGVWICGADSTITPNTSTIKLTDTSSTAKKFDGGGKTYNNIWLSGAGTGEFQFTGSNTFNDFKCDTPPHTIKFTAGTTTTVTTFTVSGTSGNLITIGSLTASSHTLTKAGGGVIDCDYLSISRSTGTPALTWYAGLHSTSGGNTSGWSFYTSTTTFNTGLFSNSGP